MRLRHHSIFEQLSDRHSIDVLRLRSTANKTGVPRASESGVAVHDFPQLKTRGLVSYYTLNMISQYMGTVSCLSRGGGKVTVVSNLTAGFAAIAGSKTLGAKVVFDLVDYFPAFVRQSRKEGHLVFIEEAIARSNLNLNLRMSDSIIAVSSVLSELARSITSRPVHLVPNGVDANSFRFSHSQCDAVRANYSLRDKVIGFVGHLDFWVDQDLILRSMKTLVKSFPRLKCLIVGGGRALPSFKKRVDDENLSTHFVFTGVVPYKDVPAYISSMSCL